MSARPAGSLSERVTIERRATMTRRAGALLDEFAPAFLAWAEIRRGASRRAVEAGQAQPLDDYEAILRLDSRTRTVTNEDRVVWKNRAYAIEGHPHIDQAGGFVSLRLVSRLQQ